MGVYQGRAFRLVPETLRGGGGGGARSAAGGRGVAGGGGGPDREGRAEWVRDLGGRDLFGGELDLGERDLGGRDLGGRAGERRAGGGAVEELGVLLDGCRVVSLPSILTTNLTTDLTTGLDVTVTTITFSDAVSMDGFWLRTGAGPAAADPATFRLERSLDAERWERVHIPRWAGPGTLGDVPTARRAYKAVDLRPPAEWLTHRALGCVQAAGIVVATALLGRARRGRAACLIIAAAVGLMGVSDLVLGIVCLSRPPAAATGVAMGYWLQGAAGVMVAVGCVWERYAIDVWLVAAPAYWLSLCVDVYLNRVGPPAWAAADAATAVSILVPWAGGVAMALLRWYARRWVRDVLVKPDRAAYDRVWEGVRAAAAADAVLVRLNALARGVAAALPAAAGGGGRLVQGLRASDGDSEDERVNVSTVFSVSSRHFLRKLSGGRRGGGGAGAGTCGGPRVASLDQLVAQAECVDIFLRRKAQGWAAAAGGRLWVRRCGCGPSAAGEGGAGLEKAAEVEVCDRVVWGRVKQGGRALEKLVRCCDLEVARLVDCCRQTVWFDGLQGVAECLEALAQDDEVELLRVKNYCDEDHDASWTAGYRAIVLNLRIRTEETARLGVDMHICELQLALTAFAELQNDERHRRYIIWRNCRGSTSLWDHLLSGLQRLFDCKSRRRPKRNAVAACEDPTTGYTGSISIVDSSSRDREGSNPGGQPDDDKSAPAAESFDQRLESLMEEQLRLAMVRQMPFGLYKDKLMGDAVVQADSGSLWDTSHPFAAALCKPWFYQLNGGMALSLLCSLALACYTFVGNNTRHGMHFRFTPLELRGAAAGGGGGWAPTMVRGHGIAGLGVTLNGCDEAMWEQGFNLTTVNASMVLSLPRGVDMNGWWFVTATDGPPEADPVRFVLEYAADAAAQQWRQVGSSSYIWTWAGALYFKDGRFETPVGRGERVSFDMRLLWPLYAIHAGISALSLAMTLLLGLAAVTKHHMKGRYVIATTYLVSGVLDLVATVGYYREGQPALAFLAGVFCLNCGLTGVLFVKAEHLLGYWIGPLGVNYIIGFVVYYVVLVDAPAGIVGNGVDLLLNNAIIGGVSQILVTCHAVFARRRSRTLAQRIVSEDRAAYDACWAALLQADTDGYLVKIRELASRLSATLPPVVLQRRRPPAPPPARPSGEPPKPPAEAHAVGPPLECLDTLFTQAYGMDLFLTRKVQDWAVAACGCLPVLPPADEAGPRSSIGGRSSIGSRRRGSRRDVQFVRWDRAAREALAGRVRWAGVKSRRRAIEKLYRSNGLAVARLLDCCRASLYFETPAGVLACLECIARDREVRLDRIKNRLDPAYDAAQTAGFRNLSVNLRVETAETVRLGLETHVCEVQLVLVPFARLATEEGHMRYKIWRNYRGQ